MRDFKINTAFISLFLLVFSLCEFSYAQIEVSNINNANQLINNLLGDGENITISNVTITGSKKSFGLFKTNLKYNTFFKDGIVMSTGKAKDAIGPNDNTKKSSKINYISDEDINIIADRKGCYDTSLFEFDLISGTDEIEFKYCFASEEYPEYIFKNVNDVFVFLITNTETNASKNIAILNGDKKTPITVDHINAEVNTKYYIENPSYNITTIEKLIKDKIEFERAKNFQYDGFTTILTARTKVIPNTKYHFKLGISDVGDQLYDSAMFLEANSLRSVGKKPEIENQLSNFKSEISLDFSINFETASSKILGEKSFTLLDEVLNSLLNRPEINIKIIGHTDSIGTNIYNDNLSLERANTVKKHLISKGVNKSRITTEGKGERLLKNNNPNDNRRVEIVFSK